MLLLWVIEVWCGFQIFGKFVHALVYVQELRLILLNAAVFLDVVIGNVAGVGGRFRGFCCLHHQGTAWFFLLTLAYQTIRHHIPWDSNCHSYHREKLEFSNSDFNYLIGIQTNVGISYKNDLQPYCRKESDIRWTWIEGIICAWVSPLRLSLEVWRG